MDKKTPTKQVQPIISTDPRDTGEEKEWDNKSEAEQAEEIAAYNESPDPEAGDEDLVDLQNEIQPNKEEINEMNNQADLDPDYLEFSPEAVGYINREQQWNTYRMISNYLPEEASVLDFGCGRGDFDRFYEGEINDGLNYIGIDMNKQLIDAGLKAYDNEVDIRCVDWNNLDPKLTQDWCININSNNIRYDADTTKTDEEYLHSTIDAMYKHANNGILILLSSSIPGEEGDLIDHNPGDIFNWAQKKYGITALDHTISDDLFLIAIYKNIN